MSSKFSCADAECYWTEATRLHADQLVFVDETGFNHKCFQHFYGHALKNKKCIMQTVGPNTQ